MDKEQFEQLEKELAAHDRLQRQLLAHVKRGGRLDDFTEVLDVLESYFRMVKKYVPGMLEEETQHVVKAFSRKILKGDPKAIAEFETAVRDLQKLW
jgi:N-acetyl-anhydromuramyl-L-alanine amidase AmpD